MVPTPQPAVPVVGVLFDGIAVLALSLLTATSVLCGLQIPMVFLGLRSFRIMDEID